ncbi:UvrD-helicase domain-containing protein [Candidatus Viridilinea mediisalina]|uniref:DNA 3'-5' helicase n=1 Tax=Candidatus Viridilinea mediisalina TaxID=2024553 RepID=A0A2A6RPX2_9CHLR|nr:UvrD-helicase domain-containing protein [Candidatus Viridilinea mediisalina]PDW05112.1 DNA helicase UvrD [Candidatus Viridilinea mediisalina]
MSARWQQIRAAAYTARQQYQTHHQGSIVQPLDLADLAECLWGLTVVRTGTLAEGIQGKVEPELQVIRVRRELTSERQRFVIAHELGHVALEGLTAGPFCDTEETLDERSAGESADDSAVRTYNTRERREQEANLFALELLVPADDLWQAAQQPDWRVEDLAAHFGVSLDAIRAQLVNVSCSEPLALTDPMRETPFTVSPPDPEQQAAVEAPLPLLLAAGPGTGKTRSMVAKYLDLVRQGIDPATILTLTFSNKAADEMRGRIVAALRQEFPDLAGRVAISTFHAWGLNVLRTYGARLGLQTNIRLLDTGDLFLLLTRHLADLQFDYFKDIRAPSRNLVTIIKAISRIKDELRTPEEYAQLAEAEAQHLVIQAEQNHAGPTKKAAEARQRAARQAAALRELAQVYPRYEAVLRQAGALDYGDLIVLAVAALHDPIVASDLRKHYHYLLIDEFQDINYASGELVRLLDGGRGRVWAVGDAWQSIYRFRGASSANLDEFTKHYPTAQLYHLTRNYRSLQSILDASATIMAGDHRTTHRPRLIAQRVAGNGVNVYEWVGQSRHDEYAAIAHDILRRVDAAVAQKLPCTSSGLQPRRTQPYRQRSQRRHRSPPLFRRWRFRDHAILCRKNDHAMQIAAVLEAHGIPVDSVRDIYETPEVKDALAICAQVRALNSAGLLRALTVPEHQMEPRELNMLVNEARRTKQALPRAARDAAIIAQLSPNAQQALARLQTIVEALAAEGDAWQVLVAYLFQYSQQMRERLTRAGRGEGAAQRELANLGQLLATARKFVRQAEPGQRHAADFIDYIRTLRAAGASSSQPIGGQPDVVRVMTVHAAKGLEFPIVYVPHLQEGQFPARGGQRGLPQPAGLIRGPVESELQEERYLLYVAMTRARDRLVLTRSTDGGRKSNGEPKVAERSSLLAGDGEQANTPWPTRILPTAHGCPVPTPEIRLLDTPPPPMPLPASSINLDGCRRRFLYQYVYQLYDDQSPFLRMHQAIRESVKQLTKQARDGDLTADEQNLRSLVYGQLQRYELDSVLYADDYAAEAWRHVRTVWEDLREARMAPERVDQRIVVRRPSGTIEVRIDREEPHADGTRWVWTRSGLPGDDDHLSERVMLYALAYQELHGDPGELAIHYTATGELRPATPKDKVLANHSAKIDNLLEEMQARRWEPSVGPHCDTCPFNLICPV